jgi:hypothetical protein
MDIFMKRSFLTAEAGKIFSVFMLSAFTVILSAAPAEKGISR